MGGVGGCDGGRDGVDAHGRCPLRSQRVHQTRDIHKFGECVLYKGLQSTNLHILLQYSAQMFKVQDGL